MGLIFYDAPMSTASVTELEKWAKRDIAECLRILDLMASAGRRRAQPRAPANRRAKLILEGRQSRTDVAAGRNALFGASHRDAVPDESQR